MADQIIPDSEFTPDTVTAPMVSEAAQGQTDFVPDSAFVSDDQALQDQYGTPGQQAKAGLEGAARGFLGSSATSGLELAAGVKPEAIRGREEANPMTAGGAEAATFLGSALAGTGEASLLTKASEMLPVTQKGSRIAQAGAGAAKAAFEGLLYQGDKELHKAFTEDPAQTSDNVIADLGMSSVLSGLFGGTVGAAFAKAAVPEAKAAGQFVSELDHPAIEAGDLAANIKAADNIKPEKKNALLNAIGLDKQKQNANKIKDAAAELGAPVLPGMTLESPLVQTQLDALIHSRYTVAGSRVGAKFDEAYTAAAGALDEAITAGPSVSKAELGSQLKDGLTNKIRTEYAPIKAGYEAYAAEHGAKPIGTEIGTSLKESLSEIPEFRVSPSSPGGKMVKQVLNDIDNVKTLDDLKIVRDGLDVGPMASSQERRMVGILRDKLTSLEEGIVGESNPLTPVYKKYISKVSELSEQLGKGKVHGTEDALRFMNERLTPEQVATRVFSKNDSGFLNFFSKNFSDEFQIVRNYQRAEMIEKATKGDQSFNAKAFFTNFNKLEPEVAAKLYSPGEIKKIKAAETYIREAFPKNFNPSGTSHMEALREAYASPKGFAVANVRDYALEKAIQFASGTPEQAQATKLAQATIKGDRAATKAVKSIFDSAKQAPASIIPFTASRAKLDRLVTQAVQDPSRLVAMNDNNNSVPEYNEPLAASASRTVNYLAALKPKTDPANTLDSKRVPSAMEKSAYDRALDIAEQPLVVLSGLKDGRITPSDIQALSTMYPNLYNKLISKVTSQIISQTDKGEIIPYKTRIGLSIFLGQPLDSTLTPAGILNAQPVPTQSPQQSEGMAKGYQADGLKKLPGQYRTPGQARSERAQQK